MHRRCSCAGHGSSASNPELNRSVASMRLEGRSGDCERSSEKRDFECTTSARRPQQMYDRLHFCPPDWCHAARDVASASEFSVAAAIA